MFIVWGAEWLCCCSLPCPEAGQQQVVLCVAVFGKQSIAEVKLCLHKEGSVPPAVLRGRPCARGRLCQTRGMLLGVFCGRHKLRTRSELSHLLNVADWSGRALLRPSAFLLRSLESLVLPLLQTE